MEDYNHNGWFVIRNLLSEDEVSSALSYASTVEVDNHQEVSVETMPGELEKRFKEIQSCVLKRITQFLSIKCVVPESWDQVFYLRVKQRYHFTPVHGDALNILVERNHFCDVVQNRFDFQNLKSIATFWITLTELSPKSSLLEIDSGSHLLGNIQLRKKSIQPQGYEWSRRRKFRVIPAVRKGDCLVFNCLTQHFGTVHKSIDPRISIDGRFWMSFESGNVEAEM